MDRLDDTDVITEAIPLNISPRPVLSKLFSQFAQISLLRNCNKLLDRELSARYQEYQRRQTGVLVAAANYS